MIIYIKPHLESQVEEFIRNAKPLDTPQEDLTVKDRLAYAAGQVKGTFRKVFPYILVGVGTGAFIHNWIPEALLAKGARLGVVLSFMMGVTTLSLPSMIMLKKGCKTQTARRFCLDLYNWNYHCRIFL